MVSRCDFGDIGYGWNVIGVFGWKVYRLSAITVQVWWCVSGFSGFWKRQV